MEDDLLKILGFHCSVFQDGHIKPFCKSNHWQMKGKHWGMPSHRHLQIYPQEPTEIPIWIHMMGVFLQWKPWFGNVWDVLTFSRRGTLQNREDGNGYGRWAEQMHIFPLRLIHSWCGEDAAMRQRVGCPINPHSASRMHVAAVISTNVDVRHPCLSHARGPVALFDRDHACTWTFSDLVGGFNHLEKY